MMDKIKLSIYSIVGNSLCITAEDGEKILEQIKKGINKEIKIELSFLNIEILTPTFLNTAIGKLYSEFDEATIKNTLSVSDISKEDKLLLKRVVKTAKLYYKHPDQFKNSIKELINTL